MKTRPSNHPPCNAALAAIFEDEPDDFPDVAAEAWHSAPEAAPDAPTARERSAVVRALAELVLADLQRGAP